MQFSEVFYVRRDVEEFGGGWEGSNILDYSPQVVEMCKIYTFQKKRLS